MSDTILSPPINKSASCAYDSLIVLLLRCKGPFRDYITNKNYSQSDFTGIDLECKGIAGVPEQGVAALAKTSEKVSEHLRELDDIMNKQEKSTEASALIVEIKTAIIMCEENVGEGCDASMDKIYLQLASFFPPLAMTYDFMDVYINNSTPAYIFNGNQDSKTSIRPIPFWQYMYDAGKISTMSNGEHLIIPDWRSFTEPFIVFHNDMSKVDIKYPESMVPEKTNKGDIIHKFRTLGDTIKIAGHPYERVGAIINTGGNHYVSYFKLKQGDDWYLYDDMNPNTNYSRGGAEPNGFRKTEGQNTPSFYFYIRT
jgi:hypothetical protein